MPSVVSRVRDVFIISRMMCKTALKDGITSKKFEWRFLSYFEFFAFHEAKKKD
jgi:hypothetical protein